MILTRRAAVYGSVLAVTIVAWILLTASGAVKPILLAAPLDVLGELGHLLSHPAKVLEPIGVTLAEATVALAVAAIAGVVTGFAIGPSELGVRAYEPLITTLSALPLVILYPVLAATLGIGSPSKVAIGALYGYFPVAIATLRAVHRVDRGLLTAARTMGARRIALATSVVLPAVSSPVIASMRVAMSLSLVTIIAAEFISGAAGVGYQLATASQGLDTPALFAWVVIAIALTVVVNIAFTMVTTLTSKGIER
ncbi:ABC transporter permease [Demequina capsici]|uniref:ABC transporter permease subunit n=1 Tax=Demequina capsici TaxID=3075620 RepID=A0AA96FBK2_9MICO|nr:ABC transporter permease subunit [Demequina sp. OYTSA14]WNM25571.1 ABC transporter permease subunit [Demequina sp. OYTSA14]